MKVFKYLLAAVGGIVILVVLALAALIATFDPNKYKPEITAAVMDKTGRTLAIEGDLGLSFFPSIGIASGKMSLSERNSSRIFARFDEVKLSLALIPLLSRQVVVDRIVISGLAADLVKHADGKTNFDDLLAAPGRAGPARPKPASSEAVNLDIAGIDIGSSKVSWRDDSSGNQFKATIDEFRTGRIASGVPGELSLSVRVEGTKPPIKFRINLSSAYRFDLEKKKVSLTQLDLRVSDDGGGASAPATSLKGDIEVDLAPQSIRFDLALDRLNLDAYLGSAKGGAPVGGPGAGRGAGAEDPIDLAALKGLNLKGKLKVAQLIASNVKLEKVNLGVQASGGRVNVNPLEAILYQGNLEGSASIDANTNRFALKSQLAGIAIGPFLRDALDNDLLEGRGNVALDLQTGGNTVSAMKKALAGSANLTLRDGALKGINLGEAIRKARALARSKPPEEQKADGAERTDFTELGASFVIKDGIAHNEDLSGKSPLLRLSGSGNVDIGGGSIDYLAKASVVQSSGGQGGQDLAQLRGVTVPVKITGPLEAPRFRVDLGATVGEVVKQKAEEELKERVQDRLKGLLRR